MRKSLRLLVGICCVGMISSLFVGCDAKDAKKGKIHITCTTFAQYDWAKVIVGDKKDDFEITYLLGKGSDMHSFQPTASDVTKVSTSEIFLGVGGESEKWTDDILKNKLNKSMQVVKLMDVLGDKVKEEEAVEGMQEEEEEEGKEMDEHVWLSVKNAKTCVKAIEEAIEKEDEENKDTYKANLEAYTKELESLDKEYKQVVDKAKSKTLIFGDRFPFRYLVDDYGLKYYAAFKGCSAETEASFETIKFLASKMDENKTSKIVVLEKSNQKIAETVLKNTKNKKGDIVSIDSIQSVAEDKIDSDYSYLSAMKSNKDVLKKVLN